MLPAKFHSEQLAGSMHMIMMKLEAQISNHLLILPGMVILKAVSTVRVWAAQWKEPQ